MIVLLIVTLLGFAGGTFTTILTIIMWIAIIIAIIKQEKKPRKQTIVQDSEIDFSGLKSLFWGIYIDSQRKKKK